MDYFHQHLSINLQILHIKTNRKLWVAIYSQNLLQLKIISEMVMPATL